MDRSTWTKIIAVIVVIIIIVAVVAIYFVYFTDDDVGEPGEERTAAIYGNANGDYYIDSEDETIIQDIINGDRDFADWPLADANHDGRITEADLTVVRNFMNGQSTTLNVINCDGDVIPVSWPVKSYAASTDTNFRAVVAVLGLADNMKANTTSSTISETLDKALYEGRQSGKIVDIGSDSAKITTEGANTIMSMGIELVLSDDGGINSDDDIVRYMEQGGVTYLKLNYKGTYDMLDSVTCLGILFGCEKTAEDYCEWCLGIMDTIEKNEGSMANTATCLCVTMSNSVSGTSSDYYAATQEVGGNNVADWEASTQKFDTGDTWLYEDKYNVDCIFHFRSTTFPTVTDSYFSNARSYFGETYTFKNGGYYLINGVIPLPVRNALMAECMYPDCFDSDWSDQLFQYYFEHFLGQEWGDYEYYWNVTATYP